MFRVMLCLLLLLLATPTAAQSIPQFLPEEIALSYGKYLWSPWRGFLSNIQPIDDNCRAYALLSEQTRAKISPRDFIAYAGQFVVFGAIGSRWEPKITVSPVRMIDQTAVVTLTAEVWRALGVTKSTYTLILRLIPESSSWRIVLTEEQILSLQRDLKDNPRLLELTPANPCPMPPTPTPSPSG